MKKFFTLMIAGFFGLFALAQENSPEEIQTTGGTLTVTFSTTNAGGGYSPKNAVAVYITNSGGELVNTLLYRTNNGHSSAQKMSTWWSLIGSSWPSSTTRKTVVKADADAITGATASSLLVNQVVYWGKTVSLSSVPDGDYKVDFEMTTGNRGYTSATFTKGTTAQTITPSNVTGFSNITISWVPNSTAVKNISDNPAYKLYPNPAQSYVYASGYGIEKIELIDLNGKLLLTTKNQHIDVSDLSGGTYFVRMTTPAGMIMKKFQKQ
ncbi:MAG: DUF2271 domain-containing protein [Paludibacter sp.]|nr:DUF2271 domain-containing protein [Paludibacter sp.]